MALIAQASIHMLRQRLGQPINKWDAKHLARDFFHGLEGDVSVYKDIIIVTYYNAPTSNCYVNTTRICPISWSKKELIRKSHGSTTINLIFVLINA